MTGVTDDLAASILTSRIQGAVCDGPWLAEIPAEQRDLTERWPECPVPIIQRKWEFDRLLELFRARKPKKILEVGSGYGGTLYYWLQNAPAAAHIVAVDSYSKNEWYGPEKDNRSKYPGWIPDGSGITLEIVEGNSQDPEVLQTAEDSGPYDWIFIDAGHKEWETLADWHNYSPMVAPGGVVVMHDIISLYYDEQTGEGLCEVPKAWAQIRALGYVTQELIAMPYKQWYTSNGHEDWSGIGIVYFP